MKTCSVYIVESEEYIKVGISSNVKKRITSLSSSSPFDVMVIQVTEFQSRALATMVENIAHKKLTGMGLHHKYEWFKRGSLSAAKLIISDLSLRYSSEVETRKDRIKSEILSRRLDANRPISKLASAERKILREKRAILDPGQMAGLLKRRDVSVVVKETGLSASTVKSIKDGKLRNMRYSTMIKMSKYLKQVEPANDQ